MEVDVVTKSDAKAVAQLIEGVLKAGYIRDEASYERLKELRAKLFRLAEASQKE